jgi:uncharacterized protein YqgC (DUF456 family)
VRTRWVSYLLIGLLFGVVDWYFLDLLASIMERLGNNADLEEAIVLRLIIIAVFISLNYGIWLVPVIPAAIYEMRQSQSLRRAAAAAVLIWVAALFSYYAFYAVLYMFVGLPNLEFALFANRDAPTYWADWWPPFKRIIVDQFIEWVGVAVVGGTIIGALSGYLYQWYVGRRATAVPTLETNS